MADQTLVPFGFYHPRLDRKLSRAPRPDEVSVRAAVYVRMSTDHQQYSTQNQMDALAIHAAKHRYTIVRTYADEGRSGLTTHNRAGLCDLFSDITSGRADYQVILVYDVSRWGRFQDCDESACYEFLCRRAGIRVEYCAEPFVNDGTPMSSIVKGLKRLMAAEYSRELSVKVFAGQSRMVRMGFVQGGCPAYGLRRLVVDETGKPRGVMRAGHRKFVHTDRTVLVPGPKDEIAVVRWIFRRAAAGKGPTAIAAELNARGVPRPGKSGWTFQYVSAMLGNEKYIGNLVYNKVSTKLRARRRTRNPPAEWVRCDGAFPAIVDPELFRRAQNRIRTWPTRMSDPAALALLKDLLARRGRLTADMIDAEDGMPCYGFYRVRFGSLSEAYRRIGYWPSSTEDAGRHYSARVRWVRRVRADMIGHLRGRGARADLVSRSVILINGLVRVGVAFGLQRTRRGKPCWAVQLHVATPVDWTLVPHLSTAEDRIVGYSLAAGTAHSMLIGVPYRRDRERHEATGYEPLLDLVLARSGVPG